MRIRSTILLIALAIVASLRADGQTNAALLGKIFGSLGTSEIQNEIFVPGHPSSSLVILYFEGPNESIKLISIAGNQSHTTWYLRNVPRFMNVISPASLVVRRRGDSAFIMLHGCARHLCGGHGLAGALVYSMANHQLYTVAASWSDSTHATEYVYSPSVIDTRGNQIKQLLDALLRDEGYNP